MMDAVAGFWKDLAMYTAEFPNPKRRYCLSSVCSQLSWRRTGAEFHGQYRTDAHSTALSRCLQRKVDLATIFMVWPSGESCSRPVHD